MYTSLRPTRTPVPFTPTDPAPQGRSSHSRRKHMSGTVPSHSRRAFITTGGRALAGIAGILPAARAPASWAARELNLLTAVNYAPASDVKLDELAKRFAK